ncbi:MAG TPA: carbamoyltransferase HypF [Clostridiales bacterium]|nr:carbamoyltransferase HypF [Clostridiales bacterium]
MKGIPDNKNKGNIPKDIALCERCLEELKDKNNRRHNYPFTNCSYCGPRYSIINDFPYDRENTTMNKYAQCKMCKDEYVNNINRRFYAQTNCCPNCGPVLKLIDNSGKTLSGNLIEMSRIYLKEGKIIAVKGIGGYHLVCNAENEKAISILRDRKKRPHKPLAVMAENIDSIKEICYVNEQEEQALKSHIRPIVLLDKKQEISLPYILAPNLNILGLMLPNSALDYLFFDSDIKYLVMTSGNISGEGICYEDDYAFDRLKGIADYFLYNNREITTPIDDSVVKVVCNEVMVSRLARGIAPFDIALDSEEKILALGAEQKVSFCLLHKGYAHLSQYFNAVDNLKSRKDYLDTIARMLRFYNVKSDYVVCDIHTGYSTSIIARDMSQERIFVQHHHAHMASCMAEINLDEEVIGVIYDGTGLGLDNAVWGGEFLVGNRSNFKRAGHWSYVNIQGYDKAVKKIWRCAFSYLYSIKISSEKYIKGINLADFKILESAINNSINCTASSSMGRLFDCVSALVKQIHTVSYDAQAAIELESIIDKRVSGCYQYEIITGNTYRIDYKKILMGIVEDIDKDIDRSVISAKFHNTIINSTLELVKKISSESGIKKVILSGGVFENTYLLSGISKGLIKDGYDVYYNTQTPINDGGISLGQIAVAAARLKEAKNVPCNTR